MYDVEISIYTLHLDAFFCLSFALKKKFHRFFLSLNSFFVRPKNQQRGKMINWKTAFLGKNSKKKKYFGRVFTSSSAYFVSLTVLSCMIMQIIFYLFKFCGQITLFQVDNFVTFSVKLHFDAIFAQVVLQWEPMGILLYISYEILYIYEMSFCAASLMLEVVPLILIW